MLPWIKDGLPLRIAVIGDIILDEYLEGEVTRISPEAPVPIHTVKTQLCSAGGAGNAARNIQLAGGQAYLFGVWGEDESARQLSEILSFDGVNVEGVVKIAGSSTIKKTRITAGRQQMIRVDWERIRPIDDVTQQSILQSLTNLSLDGILISDYAKGALPLSFLKEIFQYAKKRQILTVVDPKGRDFWRYVGCDLVTPNRKEACEALNIDCDQFIESSHLASKLKKQFNFSQVLVTLGEEGMVYLPSGEGEAAILHKPIAKEVYDVSGAGDTVAALMTLCLASKQSPRDSVEIASLGAGIVVEKWRTQPVLQSELEQAWKLKLSKKSFEQNVVSTQGTSSKMLNLQELLIVLKKLRSDFKSIVFTNGCFDVIHAGHLKYLQEAKMMGDILIVGVNSNDSVRQLKGKRRPYVDLIHRMELLAGFDCVSYVVSFNELTPLELIKAIAPNILVKGADYKVNEIVGYDFVTSCGGIVRTVDMLDGYSSSQLVETILSTN